jgi:hypothetical protein
MAKLANWARRIRPRRPSARSPSPRNNSLRYTECSKIICWLPPEATPKPPRGHPQAPPRLAWAAKSTGRALRIIVFGKVAAVKRGASGARRRGEEREQNAERKMQNAAFLAGWHDPAPKTAPARPARSRRDTHHRQAGCSGVAIVFSSYSLGVLFVFSSYSAPLFAVPSRNPCCKPSPRVPRHGHLFGHRTLGAHPDTTTKAGCHAKRNAGFIRQPQFSSPACRMNPASRWWCQEAPEPGRLFISRFSVSRFGLVSLHDVDRADDPIG